eukprot:CAMPEP_0174371908 /NCGR_PEP_ID=MMETSP0811_2-20130205/101505_1 /TAXON_ID=73025 ORGANISM="Eutreptiella gymnastica-like, Strain CCMP1594" /NCGR_SAMPLE_ID=MMETSP0811_2 /ASSEMBLY_ACC=CAM_ASM_000667 /LENGTH=67 /DNA_ID=CAMNT_0015518759 /DNA_START=575 /DNA_END=779 /DNA_ORIENTATION=+
MAVGMYHTAKGGAAGGQWGVLGWAKVQSSVLHTAGSDLPSIRVSAHMRDSVVHGTALVRVRVKAGLV